MKLFYYLLILTPFVFTACELNRSEESRVAYEIMYETYSDVRARYSLDIVGITEQAAHDGTQAYRTLGIMFSSNQYIDKEKGRKLLFAISKLFLEKINTNPKMQPFLADTPFTEKNIEIIIVVEPVDRVKLSKSELVSFYIGELGVMFTYSIPDVEYGARDEIETIEEARRIANIEVSKND
jgi:hypothetical protein